MPLKHIQEQLEKQLYNLDTKEVQTAVPSAHKIHRSTLQMHTGYLQMLF